MAGLICCVVNMGDGSKALRIAKKHGVIDGTISIGRGTVSSRLLDFLGITDTRKEIVKMIVENESAAEAIKGISEDMAFEKPHHGIAFSYFVSEFASGKYDVDDHINVSKEKGSMYNAIFTVVEKGRAEEVIEAANKAGARGGTIVNARGSGNHEEKKLFSLEIEPEKEEVFIIAKRELKNGIVESIRSHLKLEEPGNGIMFILDVNEAYGLH